MPVQHTQDIVNITAISESICKHVSVYFNNDLEQVQCIYLYFVVLFILSLSFPNNNTTERFLLYVDDKESS